MTGIDALVGINTPKLNVPSTFRPTFSGRTWLVEPLNVPIWSMLLALLPALLACILIFMVCRLKWTTVEGGHQNFEKQVVKIAGSTNNGRNRESKRKQASKRRWLSPRFGSSFDPHFPRRPVRIARLRGGNGALD